MYIFSSHLNGLIKLVGH